MAAGFVFSPLFYKFDNNGVSICYIFLSEERYLWKNISAISVENDPLSSKMFFLSQVFKIYGYPEGKKRFYIDGCIGKTFRTKRYIERYWDGTVTGYFGEGIKAWAKRRSDKKAKHIRQHFTDEVVKMEREARAKAREIIAPYVEHAQANGFELSTRYVYITSDGKEITSRPKGRYEYTAVVEIREKGETDDERMVDVSVELIDVRLGKTAYRGVENRRAAEELNGLLADTLDEIIKTGIDVFCKG